MFPIDVLRFSEFRTMRNHLSETLMLNDIQITSDYMSRWVVMKRRVGAVTSQRLSETWIQQHGVGQSGRKTCSQLKYHSSLHQIFCWKKSTVTANQIVIPRDVVAGTMISITLVDVEDAGAFIVLMHGQLHAQTFKMMNEHINSNSENIFLDQCRNIFIFYRKR